MVRYKEYVKKMLEENSDLFNKFKDVHDKYSSNQEKYQNVFNQIGEDVLTVIKEYENRVCANTERGKYFNYSGNLAEKFQNEIRKIFPMIDYIGVKSHNTKTIDKKDDPFFIKKIL